VTPATYIIKLDARGTFAHEDLINARIASHVTLTAAAAEELATNTGENPLLVAFAHREQAAQQITDRNTPIERSEAFVRNILSQ